MIICTVCETPNSPETRFCNNCGASLAGAKLVATEVSPFGTALAEPPQIPDAPSRPAPLSAALSTPCPGCGELNASDSVYCEGCGYSLRSALAPSNDGAVAPESGPKLPALLDVPDSIDAGPSIAAGIPVLVPDLEPTAQPRPRYEARPTLLIASSISVSLVVEDDGTHFNLSGKDLILVGRTDAERGIYPDIDLTAHGGELGGVSRRHIQLQVRGNGWVVEDVGSLNGTWLNGQRLMPGAPQPLAAGDHLLLGGIGLRCVSV